MGTNPIYEIVAVNSKDIVIRDSAAPGSDQDFIVEVSTLEAKEFAGLRDYKNAGLAITTRLYIRSLKASGAAYSCSVIASSGKSRQTQSVVVSPETFQKLEYVFAWRALDWEMRPALPHGVRAQ